MVVHGVQLLKEDEISVCSQDTGLPDEKKTTITMGEKKGKMRRKNEYSKESNEGIPSKESEK